MRKSNLLIVLMTVFGSCQCEQEPLEEVLGNPCYTDSDNNIVELNKNSEEYEEINTGICSSGITDKDERGVLICVNEIKPQEEVCNNLDDNCNGYVDDEASGFPLYRAYYDSENTCGELGVCRFAVQRCLDGQWVCEYPISYGKERCDGLDNDCDGERDEDTEEDPIFDDSERFVYTADPETINVGECRAGYKECVDGTIYIRNMRTPVPEICGNDDDDDCDGATDERETDEEGKDFALIIDYSGSMMQIIDIVADSLCSWSNQGILQTSRFAVVAIGYSSLSADKEIKVLTDFTDSQTACEIIRSNNQFQYYGSLELQLDATYNISNSDSIHYLNWMSEQKKVLIFSDELMQQDFALTIQDAVDIVVQQCIEQNYNIGAFVSYNTPDQQYWLNLTQGCSGFLDYLNYNPQEMIDTLNYWVGTDCSPN